MSNAWEVMTEDVRQVLTAHWGISPDDDTCNMWFDELEPDEIEESVLGHTNFDQQVDQALSDIEDTLALKGAFKRVKNYQKKFLVGDDSDYEAEAEAEET
jgi:hypothetical protein